MSSGGWGGMCVRENEHTTVCFCVGWVLVWGRFFENSQRMKLGSKIFLCMQILHDLKYTHISLCFTFICSPVCSSMCMLLHLDSSMYSKMFCMHFMHAACLPRASVACHQLGLFVSLILEHNKAKASGCLLCEPPPPPPFLPNRLLES